MLFHIIIFVIIIIISIGYCCIKSFYQLYYLTNKLDQKYSARSTLQNYYTLVQKNDAFGLNRYVC